MQTEARKLHPNLSWRVPIRLRSFNRPKAFSSFPIKALAEAEWLSSVAAVRKDWPGSGILQPPTQLGAVIGLVAEALRCCGDEPFRGTVIRFAAGQEDGEKAAPSECGDLRVAPASFPVFYPLASGAL